MEIESLKLTTLFKALSKNKYFGRSDVINVLKISSSVASKLISKLLDLKVIIPVLKHGKGKYSFNIVGVNYE